MFVSTKAGRVLTVLLLAALLTFGFALTALAAEIVPTLSNILIFGPEWRPQAGQHICLVGGVSPEHGLGRHRLRQHPEGE